MVETGTRHFPRFKSSVCCLQSPHRVYRVVTAAFLHTFHHESKNKPRLSARPPPFITFTITSKVAVYAPAEWADTLT